MAEYPRQSVLRPPNGIPDAIRSFQQSLLRSGWEPRPCAEFSKGDVWLGFTWTMGQVRVSVWRRPEGGASRSRAVRDYGLESDPAEVEMLKTVLESAGETGNWPPEGFRLAAVGHGEE